MNRRVTQDENVTLVMSERFAELMRERGMSQQDTSYALRLSPTVINRWVKGKHAISAANIATICRYFNVSADWLLGLSDERRPRAPRARTAEEIVEMADELERVAQPRPKPRSQRRA